MMKKAWKQKNIFSLGEISPNLYHRFDLPQYEAGLRVLKNGFAKVEGTVTNCPELELLQQFNMGAVSSMRWFKYNTDDRVPKKCIMVLITTEGFKLFTVTEANTFGLEKEFSSAYTPEEIKRLSITQVENHILICCIGKKPNMIRIDEYNLGNSVVVNFWEGIVDPPVKNVQVEFANTINNFNCCQWHKNPYGSEVTVKINHDPQIFSKPFTDRLVNGQMSLFGNLYRINSVTNEGVNITFNMTGIDESGLKAPTNKLNQDTNKYEDVWETFDIRKMSFMESLFNNNSYPSVCAYYQGRLVLANIQNNPDFVCFSKTGDYFRYTGTTKEQDSGFALAVPSDDRTVISGLISWNSLIILSENGVWSTPIMQSLTPTNSFISRQLVPNISNIEENYVISNGALYYVNYFNNKVYTLLYNYDSKMYTAEEISTYSSHLLSSGIRSINKMQYEGNEYIMCDVNNNIEPFFAMCTIDRQQGVTSWNRYTHINNVKLLNIETDTLFMNLDNGVIRSYVPSYTLFKSDMEIQLLPPTLGAEDRYVDDCPYIAKSGYSYQNVIVSVIGEYEIDVNGDVKELPFDTDFTQPFNIRFDIVNAETFFNIKTPLTIKNKTNKKVEISAIYYTISSEKEII